LQELDLFPDKSFTLRQFDFPRFSRITDDTGISKKRFDAGGNQLSVLPGDVHLEAAARASLSRSRSANRHLQ
jgi:hypothetical protein